MRAVATLGSLRGAQVWHQGLAYLGAIDAEVDTVQAEHEHMAVAGGPVAGGRLLLGGPQVVSRGLVAEQALFFVAGHGGPQAGVGGVATVSAELDGLPQVFVHG